ncbi:sigma 54-interacting transcriptional regulator [Clostridium drakei]|uniref:PTS sugar transporter subunit IIA n=1 Tax=Clostridium drakei TaxID=332101 RepID=A0A2U8DR29_9CLOT|nr:sigma-54-dependent transcriptional regulator [Clostridium drakei]AWI05237.1 PTS sugar transporter subunit IIA [Clostridium drakei]
MKKSEDIVFEYLYNKCKEQKREGLVEKLGCSTKEIADSLTLQRTNVSSILNVMCRQGKIFKIKGKPIIYYVNLCKEQCENSKNFKENYISFNTLIGKNKSLKKCIEQAKAAILYPPNGLHTLLLGPTGVGKTMFAEVMYKFAIEKGSIPINSPFVSFNCADYANNPQLILAHLFGSKKGAFTGADRDKDGLVDKANGGILFLDEIHRLPPEGQEMLFMIIDKGIYTPLGDIEKKKISKVRIICATTENVDSVLLNTFSRRIPITINIPMLKDRSLEERFELICEFFKTESERIGREIFVSTNTIRALLLYSCTGNIGQLKGDIQLGCANAFLKYVSKGKKKIEVHSTDFLNNVRQGLLLYKQNSQVLDNIINEDIELNFNSKITKHKIKINDKYLPNNFYESIEKRIQELKERGIEENDINFLMDFDIKKYLKKYVGEFEQEVKKEELSKIVDKKIINIVEKFLDIASKKMKKVFPVKIFYGLCLHINSSIERIISNKNLLNHNLNEILEKDREEYKLALVLVDKLEEEFNIKIPLQETEFIAMFLCIDDFDGDKIAYKPIIVVAMHGESTASSMTEVANKLVGGNNVYGYDMTLDKNPQTAYIELKDFIRTNHQGFGVILLVDMGSLGMFGELISEETGIEIRVIDMVSTLLVIECARKALTNNNINIICEEAKQSVSFLNNYNISLSETYIPRKDNIIITNCITGEGSAIKVKNMIEEKINLSSRDIQIVPLSASDREEMYNTINILSKNNKILAIVGTVNPNVYGIPFIPVSELFLDSNYTRLKDIVNRIKTLENFYNEIFQSLESEIEELNMDDFRPLCTNFLDNVKENITDNIDIYMVSGLILHLACAIMRLINKENTPKCTNKQKVMSYSKEYDSLKEALRPIERFYNIKFSDDEFCHILIIILNIVNI